MKLKAVLERNYLVSLKQLTSIQKRIKETSFHLNDIFMANYKIKVNSI